MFYVLIPIVFQFSVAVFILTNSGEGKNKTNVSSETFFFIVMAYGLVEGNAFNVIQRRP